MKSQLKNTILVLLTCLVGFLYSCGKENLSDTTKELGKSSVLLEQIAKVESYTTAEQFFNLNTGIAEDVNYKEFIALNSETQLAVVQKISDEKLLSFWKTKIKKDLEKNIYGAELVGMMKYFVNEVDLEKFTTGYEELKSEFLHLTEEELEHFITFPEKTGPFERTNLVDIEIEEFRNNCNRNMAWCICWSDPWNCRICGGSGCTTVSSGCGFLGREACNAHCYQVTCF